MPLSASCWIPVTPSTRMPTLSPSFAQSMLVMAESAAVNTPLSASSGIAVACPANLPSFVPVSSHGNALMAALPVSNTPLRPSSANPAILPASVPSFVPVSSHGNASMAALPAVKMPLTSSRLPLSAVLMVSTTVSAKLPHSCACCVCSPSAGGLNSVLKNAVTLDSTP